MSSDGHTRRTWLAGAGAIAAEMEELLRAKAAVDPPDWTPGAESLPLGRTCSRGRDDRSRRRQECAEGRTDVGAGFLHSRGRHGERPRNQRGQQVLPGARRAQYLRDRWSLLGL